MIDTGDNSWVMSSSIFVYMMALPGLGLFFAGMTKDKADLVKQMLLILIVVAVVTFSYLTFGYSLSSSPSLKGENSSPMIGSSQRFWLNNLDLDSIHQNAPNISETVYCFFQLSFASTGAVLVAGSLDGKLSFLPLLVFIFFWHICVYCPIAYWNWHPNGFLKSIGVMDFAGGNVVHVASGWTSFVAGQLLHIKRADDQSLPNYLLVISGTAMIWIGWFGFNGGSALNSGQNAGMAVLVTQLSASMSLLTWLICEKLWYKNCKLSGVAKGIFLGLVGITPASGYVDCNGGIFIGILCGVFCFFVSVLKQNYNVNDKYDSLETHVAAGGFGIILVGFFSKQSICSSDLFLNENNHCQDGIFYGGSGLLLGKQIYSFVVSSVWSIFFSSVLLRIIIWIFNQPNINSEEKKICINDFSEGHLL